MRNHVGPLHDWLGMATHFYALIDQWHCNMLIDPSVNSARHGVRPAEINGFHISWRISTASTFNWINRRRLDWLASWQWQSLRVCQIFNMHNSPFRITPEPTPVYLNLCYCISVHQCHSMRNINRCSSSFSSFTVLTWDTPLCINTFISNLQWSIHANIILYVCTRPLDLALLLPPQRYLPCRKSRKIPTPPLVNTHRKRHIVRNFIRNWQ